MNARTVAARVVAKVADGGERLDRALEAERIASMTPQLRAAVMSLSYGAVRGHFRYDAILRMLVSRPIDSLPAAAHALLSVALFELEEAQTPEYAVVDAAVDTARLSGLARLASVCNAVLRRYLRERGRIDARIAQDPPARHGFPEWLAVQWREDWPDQALEFMASSDVKPPLWLRVNRRLIDTDAYLRLLTDARIQASRSEHVPYALMLHAPLDVGELPGFDRGLVSVQDVNAQLAAIPLALSPGLHVLDACAAPGGKTGLIGECEPALGRLTALDIDALRMTRVRDNLERVGVSAELVCADLREPQWCEGKTFDRILLDAPCSAFGIIRRQPDIRLRRTPADAARFAATQMSLLSAAWKMLTRGGRLVYSTCTLNHRENRELVAEFTRSHAEARLVPVDAWAGWPRLGHPDGFGVQTGPGEAGGDGFYYAALVKE